jgi:hypothetical protein
MYGFLGLNDFQPRILATLQEPDGGSVGLGDTTKLCVPCKLTPARRHRAQQLTGGQNIGVPASWLETAFWEVTHPANLTGNARP